MASNTSNLNLLKKDPLTDGKDTFNIKTMLNDNWDILDAKIGDLKAIASAFGLDPESASVSDIISNVGKVITGSNAPGSDIGRDGDTYVKLY